MLENYLHRQSCHQAVRSIGLPWSPVKTLFTDQIGVRPAGSDRWL